MCAGVGSGCNFRKVLAGSGECGLLPGNLDRSRHVIVFGTPFGDDIVRMGKTAAEQECAHVVKHGIRLLLWGISPKLISYFFFLFSGRGLCSIVIFWFCLVPGSGSGACLPSFLSFLFSGMGRPMNSKPCPRYLVYSFVFGHFILASSS